MTLEFASLTTFNRGSKKMGYDAYPLLIPQPEFVFRNLARRWEDIAPPELIGLVESERLERYLQEDDIIIVDYDLRPHQMNFTTHQQHGFLGTCTYQLRGFNEAPTAERPSPCVSRSLYWPISPSLAASATKPRWVWAAPASNSHVVIMSYNRGTLRR
ncbi:MAG TPA: CRISPR system precrRNA processing endoribonuclease RAMP protein Cas6 [Ktedonosporobacter sp.]|nr:CRISPR system precrRNA processing endoribonuclease RAMP protein Cas6 [Ktedonosporobacter sp.]